MKLIIALTLAAVSAGSAGCSTPIVGADGYVDFERTFAQHRRVAPPAMPQMYTPPAPQQPYTPQTRACPSILSRRSWAARLPKMRWRSAHFWRAKNRPIVMRSC